MKRLAIFASGSGTNAENIIQYFEHRDDVEVTLILSNKSDAYVLQRAANHEIPSVVFTRNEFYNTDQVVNTLIEHEIDLVVLAGFLWLIPANLIEAFPDKIVNIHPSLLPKYGGKGMFGAHVHEAVIAAGEQESGITIHLVNAEYDKGRILHQSHTLVTPTDTPESLAKKIHQLEYDAFPKVIDQILTMMN